MKKIISLLLVASFGIICASCQKNIQDEKSGSSLTVNLENSYQSSPVTVIDLNPWEEIGTGLNTGRILDTIKDYAIFQFGNTCYAYNYVLNESFELYLPYLDQYKNDENYYVDYVLVPGSNDNFYIIYYTFEAETMNQMPIYLEKYDSDFNCLDGQILPDAFYPAEGNYNIYAIDINGNWFISSLDDNGAPEIAVYSSSFELVTIIKDSTINGIMNIFRASDGQVYLEYNSSTKKHEIGRIDTDSFTIVNVPVDMTLDHYCRRGNDKYIITTYNETGLYGINADGRSKRIVDWFTSDICSNNLVANDPILLENGSVILTEGEYLSMGTYQTNINRHWLLSPRSEEDINNLTYITLSVLSEQTEVISQYVRNYNRQSDDVYIIIYNYDEISTDSRKSGYNQMYQDMVEGTVADIICTNGLPQEQFYTKHLYKDLTELYHNEKNLTNKNYFTNFFDSLYKDDRLFEFSFSYSISTLAAKSKYVKDIERMDLTSFINVLNSNNIDPFPYPMYQRSESFNTVVAHSISSWVDPDMHQCNFESDDFVQLLEGFSRMYMDEEFLGYGNEQEYMEFLEIMSNSYKEDRAIFDIIEFTDPYDWHTVHVIDFDEADITYIGWPSVSGGDGNYFVPKVKFAINAESKYDEEAWDFLMYLLSDEVQEGITDALPVNRKAMESRLQTAMVLPKDPTGIDAYPAYTIGDKKYPLTNATQKEMDDFIEFVEKIDSTLYENVVINNIVSEECEQYFKGDDTSTNTAKKIQSRVSTYLSEVS